MVELLGERQLWWKCCSEAVRTDPSWLFGSGSDELRSWVNATAPDRAAGSVTPVDHAYLLGRALSAPEGHVEEQDQALARLLEEWGQSGLISADAATGPAQPSGRGVAGLSPRIAGGLSAVIERIERLHPADGARLTGPRRMLVIAALLMAGAEPRRRPLVTVPVVFGRPARQPGDAALEQGATGVLELREFPAGPAGLYPDPRAMTGVHSPNGQFAASVGHAWNVAGSRREGRCVLWRIVLTDDPLPPPRIEGPSLGAAFALGLRELLRYPQSRRPSVAGVRGLFYGLRPRTAVTGALDGGERLLKVSDMDAKLLAARRKGLRLVAPQANRLDVANAPEPGNVKFADTLRQADRYARRFRTGRLVTALALVATATATGLLVAQQNAADTNHQRDIAISNQLSIQSQQLGATDPTLARLESLVAWRIAPTAQARYAMLTTAALPRIAALPSDTTGTQALAFSPDGKTLATGNAEGTVRLWSVADRQQAGMLPTADMGMVKALAFSPDGKVLATGNHFGPARLWNVATHQQIGENLASANSGSSNAVAFSPDGDTFAVGSADGTVRLWNMATNQQIGQPLNNPSDVLALAFSPDGKALATGILDGTARLWNVTTHQEIGQPLTIKGTTALTNAVRAVAFSPDGGTLATGGDDGTARLWNVATEQQIGQPLTTAKGTNANTTVVRAVVFSPDGGTLATGAEDGTARLWNVATGQQIGQPLTTADMVSTVAFSPDGKTLATGGNDAAQLWNVAAYEQIGKPPVTSTGNMNAVAFSPDGRTLVTAGQYDGVRMWNVSSTPPRQIGQSLPDSSFTSTVAFSPDGKTLATGTDLGGTAGTVRLWDAATRQEIGRPLPGGLVNVVAFSPDGKALATGSGDGTVQLWDVATHQRIGEPFSTSGDVNGLVFSPDGRNLATSDVDGPARLWNVDTHQQVGEPLAAPDDVPTTAVAFSPDGNTLAVAARDTTVRFWDVETRHQIGQPIAGRIGIGNAMAFSPDGKALATGSGDGTVRLWDVETYQQIGQPLTGDVGYVGAVAFSPDGKTLATGWSDLAHLGNGSAQLWDVGYLVDTPAWLCSRVQRSLSGAEWAKYVPVGPSYRKTCP
ncbi:hypothetical protein [Kitasatospora sp. NPDC057936]|uniref:hypothetical protein n=1 Tax=Kitasatospora sp. NPDC057936 TaxID=3346283 RepID=UPI0036D8F433